MTGRSALVRTVSLASAVTRQYLGSALQEHRQVLRAGRPRRKGQGASGFTLVEVIVAIAILSIGLSVTLGLMSEGVRQLGRAKKAADAGSLAQSLLAQVGTEVPIKEGESNGRSSNGYSWRLKISVYGDLTERERWPLGAFLVSAQITWDDHEARRNFALTTLRLGPKEMLRR